MPAPDAGAHYPAAPCPVCKGPSEPSGDLDRLCRWCFHVFRMPDAIMTPAQFGRSLVGLDVCRSDLQGIVGARFPDWGDQDAALKAYEAAGGDA